MVVVLAYEEAASSEGSLEVERIAFTDAAVVANPEDNAAIATRDLPAGCELVLAEADMHGILRLPHRVLEGHRFARVKIERGRLINSWGQPFGRALHPIGPGDWLRNTKVIAALQARRVAIGSASSPNFEDYIKPLALSDSAFRPGEQLPLVTAGADFGGYVRAPPRRGVGTRNYAVVLCVSARSNAFARALAKRCVALAGADAAIDGGFDGVVALPHTEDGGNAAGGAASNRQLLLRTLLGLLLHPNVGAALVLQTAEDVAASQASRGVRYDDLQCLAHAMNRAEELHALPHAVHTLNLGHWQEELERTASLLRDFTEPLRSCRRSSCSAADLMVAQQCGGSDAFSGTNANPLVAEACKLLIQAGGTAVLAETDELIGAEQYVLSSVRDLRTARKFVTLVDRFHQYARSHGASAEGNPSGGNLYRGLYNIALKSLGAAMKRHPDVRLERVVEYSEPLLLSEAEAAAGNSAAPSTAGGCEAAATTGAGSAAAATGDSEPLAAVTSPPRGTASSGEVERRGQGYCFMDSPGNDLESIAGQVAAGCNVIYFTTGNGSITNFPFVPTIKVVSTHKRFEMMMNDMDFDAGGFAASKDRLAMELWRLTLDVAGGRRTKGESAGHYQLQIWRDWAPVPDHPRWDEDTLARDHKPSVAVVEGRPLSLSPSASASSLARSDAWRFDALPSLPSELLDRRRVAASPAVDFDGLSAAPRRWTSEWVALVLPTSLCSSEVARALAERLQTLFQETGIRFVSLPHTEGCGVSDEKLGAEVLVNHLLSPLVAHALLLEHGCEKTHNDYFTAMLRDRQVDPLRFGWASLQADGGIDRVKARVTEWFSSRLLGSPQPSRRAAPLSQLGLGMLVDCLSSDAAPTHLSGGTEGSAGADDSESLARLFAQVAGFFAAGGGLVVIPEASALLRNCAFTESLLGEEVRATLYPAARASCPGLHVMQAVSTRRMETLTALGSAGVHLILTLQTSAHLDVGAPGHPMVPTLSLRVGSSAESQTASSVDLLLEAHERADWLGQVLQLLSDTASGRHVPLAFRQQNTDVQIPRAGAVSL